MSQGPTSDGVRDLVDLDDGAYWDDLNDRVVSTQAKSKRIVPIVIFHTADYVASGCGGTGCMVKVVNIMGFFVEGMCDTVASQGRLDPETFCDTPEKTVVGRLVSHESQVQGWRRRIVRRGGLPEDLPSGPIGAVKASSQPRRGHNGPAVVVYGWAPLGFEHSWMA